MVKVDKQAFCKWLSFGVSGCVCVCVLGKGRGCSRGLLQDPLDADTQPFVVSSTIALTAFSAPLSLTGSRAGQSSMEIKNKKT